MRVALASAFACGVGLWRRLHDEGHEVRVWRGTEKAGSPELLYSHRNVGRGIVNLCDSWYELLAWAKEAPATTLVLFDASGLGKQADEARKAGLYVLGGGSFMDRLEKDRGYGANVAEAAGMNLPPCMEFKSLDETLAFARSGKLDRPVYWKTDVYISGDATHCCETSEELIEYLEWMKTLSRNQIYNVLEEKVDGTALSTARWWNGRSWIGPYEWTLERKRFMSGEVGPSTGCSLNAIGFYEEDAPFIAGALQWDALGPLFLKREAPPGLYDVNAVVCEGEAYFLEWTPRFGWDSEGTSLALCYDDLSAWLWHVATGQGDGSGVRRGEIALGLRLSVPPYPSEGIERDDKASCVGVPVRGEVGDLWSKGFVGYQLAHDAERGLHVAAPEGIVGLTTARGDSASDLAEATLEFAKKRLRVPGLQYRCDAGDAILEDAQGVAEQGFDDLPEGLVT